MKCDLYECDLMIFLTEYKCCMGCIASGNALVEVQVKTDQKMAWLNYAKPTVCIIVYHR